MLIQASCSSALTRFSHLMVAVHQVHHCAHVCVNVPDVPHHRFRLLPRTFLHDLCGTVSLRGLVDRGADAGAVTRPAADFFSVTLSEKYSS